MESLPSPHEQHEAFEKLIKLRFWRLEGESEEYIATQRLGFNSAEHMYQQLKKLEWPDWAVYPEPRFPESKEPKARGGGDRRSLRPAAEAADIFEDVVHKLSVFLERLPLRREYWQGRRFVLTKARPYLEVPEPSENTGYAEAPPDALPDEEGHITFTLDESCVRVPGGAARYPDDEFTAAVTAALLTGTSTDELLDALQDNPTHEVRQKARIQGEGDAGKPSTVRDSLKSTAGRMAALIWGHPVERGNKTNPVSKEWQAATWLVRGLQKEGYSYDEIAQRLNANDAYLPELKKQRRITVDDMQDMDSLGQEPY